MSEAANEHEGLARAERLFAKGDYAAATPAYLGLAADPSLTAEQRVLVEKRLRALRPDPVTVSLGVITAAVVIFVYLLSRFWLGH